MKIQNIPHNDKTSTIVLLKYLHELRKEMFLRIERAFKLSLYKLFSLGVIISIVILQPNVLANKYTALAFCGLIPIIVICYDLLIAKNYRLINTTGYFIRERVETHLKEQHDLSLYEPESFTIPTLMNSIIEIGISYIATIYALMKIPSGLPQLQVIAIKTVIIIIFVLSSIQLIKSRPQYKARKDIFQEGKLNG